MPRIIISCEHGGRRVPRRYARLFKGHEARLASHRGYDPGALALARAWARELDAPLYATTISRLLVDCNRSPHHPALFSEITRPLDRSAKETILARYYLPHRRAVEEAATRALESGRTLVHLAVHTFTPELAGRLRRADIGLLYDPARPAEARFCRAWQQRLRDLLPGCSIRRNYPYAGRTDGLCTFLRRRFPESLYLGIELEINQRQVLQTTAKARLRLRHAILQALAGTMASRDLLFSPSFL